MGACSSCFAARDRRLRCHVIVYKQIDDSKPISLDCDTDDFFIQDFAITESGSLFVPCNKENKGDCLWARRYAKNHVTLNHAILSLSFEEAKSASYSFIANVSFESGAQSPVDVWELLNFTEAMHSRKGVKVEEGDSLRLGEQKLHVAILNLKAKSDNAYRPKHSYVIQAKAEKTIKAQAHDELHN